MLAIWRRALIISTLTVFAGIAMLSHAAADNGEGDGAGDDFGDLGLEELMEVEVVPISVLGTHTHLADEWMVGYKYMSMEMEGNRNGTSRVSVDDVLDDFMVAPLKMTMEMHMAMVMYAPSDDLTLMGMLPYVRKKMNRITRTNVSFTTKSDGVGDAELSALYTFYRHNADEHRFIVVAGLSLPTGSIDERDFLANPSQGRQKLPYPMQLGSGTVDLPPGLTYLGQSERLAWGVEFDTRIRLGRNSNHYALGNRFHAAAWGNWEWTDWMAPFVRFDAESWGDIDGADPDLNPAMAPTADPTRRGGDRIDFFIPEGMLKGQRLGIQVGRPIHQSLHGPQLETDWTFAIGWQWVF